MFTSKQLREEMLRRSATSMPSSDNIAALTNEELLAQIRESDLVEREKLLYRIVIADSWSNSLNFDRAVREFDEILNNNASMHKYPEIFALAQLKKVLVNFSRNPSEFESSIDELKSARSLLRDYSSPAGGNSTRASRCARLLDTVEYSEIKMRFYKMFGDYAETSKRKTNTPSKKPVPWIERDDVLNYIYGEDRGSKSSLKDSVLRFATGTEHLYEMSWLRKHMVLLRYIVHSDSNIEAQEAGSEYCELLLRRKNASGPSLSHGYANPWELIELYRAFLLEKMSPKPSETQNHRKYVNKAVECVNAAFNSVRNHPYPYMGLKQCIIQTYLKGAQLYLTGRRWERERLFQKNVAFLKKCSEINAKTDLKQFFDDQPQIPGHWFRYSMLPNYEEALQRFQMIYPRDWGVFYHLSVDLDNISISNFKDILYPHQAISPRDWDELYTRFFRHDIYSSYEYAKYRFQEIPQRDWSVFFGRPVLQQFFYWTVPFILW